MISKIIENMTCAMCLNYQECQESNFARAEKDSCITQEIICDIKTKIDMKLQNNFTTVEQSKRLLKLGVPYNSADCYISNENRIIVLHDKTFKEEFEEDLDLAKSLTVEFPHYTPCWSVGRLIEIIRLCHDDTASLVIQDCTPDYLVGVISCQVNLKYFDFSKLKD